VGIITSMFSSIMGTRALVNLIYGGRRVKSLAIGGIGNKRSSTEGAPA
jgi:preprotein translocase subunit SecD